MRSIRTDDNNIGRRTERVEANGSSVDGAAAEAAAQEVAEASEMFASGGLAIEPAVQAGEVAVGLGAEGAPGEAELTHEERRSVGRNVFRLAWPAIAENAL